MVRRTLPLLVLTLSILSPTVLMAQDDAAKTAQAATQEKKEEKKELKLEDLFPERSFFGPSASNMAFSADGRYAAYLYRPYIERRHGSDLWLLDTTTGEVTRLTSVSVMAEFQEETRKVKADREEKAKKEGVGQKKTEGDAKGETKVDAKSGDTGAAIGPDPVTGTWEGRITGGADMGLPPEGVAYTLSVQLRAGGEVSGSIAVMGQSHDLVGGKFDAATGKLTGRFSNAETGMGAALDATIQNGGISGKITIDGIGVVLEMTGTRKQAPLEPALLVSPEPQDGGRRSGGSARSGASGDDGKTEGKQEEKQIILGDWVGEKDAEDERAPRYAGIQSFVWSPTAPEFIFTSGGDLYRYDVPTKQITRLTKTKQSERSVQYLPDGSGYAYMSGDAIMKVVWGSSFVEQLDPALPGGETMSGFELSPDGTRMVFLTRRSTGPAPSRTVNIITYRDRFAEVRQVPRHVSDDPLQPTETSIYLYDMRDVVREDLRLGKVYTHTGTGPRDILQVPEWAPDSSKVGFAVFTQKTGLVEVFEASFPVEEKKPANAKSEGEALSAAQSGDGGEPQDQRRGRGAGEAAPAQPVTFPPAKMVYRFFHNGGPNTPVMIHPYYLWDSQRMVFLTEQSGFRQLHILDPVYESLEQITFGRFETYPFGISKDHRKLFVTATKEHPTQEDVYVVDLDERVMTRLSKENGTYAGAAVSNDGAKALATYNRYGTLRELYYLDAAKGEQKQLTESHPDKARELTAVSPEFFTYRNRHGHEIHGHMFKPDGWTRDDKRPLLIYVYGGPLGTRKQVVDGSYDSAGYFFGMYMAKKHGYLTVTIDPRGVSGYAGVFEKANFEQVGKPQVEDLVDGVKFLIENYGVDPKRVGMHGWSFGGFQTQMCMYTEPDVFACGIAGAGPTEWENYNSWYSQGTIGETGQGTADLKKYSLLPLAKNLKGRLLLIHGMEDSNVLYQDTVRVYRELLRAGKETLVELFLDPTGGHGLGGDVKTLNRYRKYEEFLLRVMGSGNPPPAP